MADFWHVKKLFPYEDPHKGVSVILINSKKAANLLEHMKSIMIIKELDKQFVIEQGGQLHHPTSKHKKRDEFFSLLDEEDFNKMTERLLKRPLIRRIASNVLPEKIKHLIRKTINL